MAFRFYPISTISPILQRSLKWRKKDLTPSIETIEIIIAAGKYENFLKEMIEGVVDPGQRHRISEEQLKYLLAYATPEQIEKWVMPKIRPFLEKNYDYSDHKIFQAMPIIFNKLSADYLENLLTTLFKLCEQRSASFACEELLLICIEKLNAKVIEEKIIPSLIQLCEKVTTSFLLFILEKALPKCFEKLDSDALETTIVPALSKLYKITIKGDLVGKVIKKCVEKMSPDAAERSMRSDLESCFSQLESSVEKEEKGIYHKIVERDIAFIPYLYLISRLNKETVDKISERLLRHLSINLSDYTADPILAVLKELRSKKIYVNEDFFQAVHKIIFDLNEKHLKDRNHRQLIIAHMTTEQITRFIEKEDLVSELKMESFSDERLDLTSFEKFAEASMEEYPMQLRMKSLRFLQAQLDNSSVIYSLPKCLKTDDFSNGEYRVVLIDLAKHALKKN